MLVCTYLPRCGLEDAESESVESPTWVPSMAFINYITLGFLLGEEFACKWQVRHGRDCVEQVFQLLVAACLPMYIGGYVNLSWRSSP